MTRLVISRFSTRGVEMCEITPPAPVVISRFSTRAVQKCEITPRFAGRVAP